MKKMKKDTGSGVQTGLSEKQTVPKGYQPRGETTGQRPTKPSEKAGGFTIK